MRLLTIIGICPTFSDSHAFSDLNLEKDYFGNTMLMPYNQSLTYAL